MPISAAALILRAPRALFFSPLSLPTPSPREDLFIRSYFLPPSNHYSTTSCAAVSERERGRGNEKEQKKGGRKEFRSPVSDSMNVKSLHPRPPPIKHDFHFCLDCKHPSRQQEKNLPLSINFSSIFLLFTHITHSDRQSSSFFATCYERTCALNWASVFASRSAPPPPVPLIRKLLCSALARCLHAGST